MAKGDKLTTKQQAFAVAVAAGSTLTDAARDAGYSPTSPDSTGALLVQNPKVAKSIIDLMEEQGLTDEFLLSKHKELIEATRPHNVSCGEGMQEVRMVPDNPVRAKVLELGYKLKRHLSEEEDSKGINVNVNIGSF